MYIVFWERETSEEWNNSPCREWAVCISEHKAKTRLSEVHTKYGQSVTKHGIAKIDEKNTLFDRL